jgi:DNA-binding transcriptional regulator GbsR (MarR family)
MLLDDRQMKVHEIAEIIGISKERIGYILHEELDMKKLCARCGDALARSRSKTHSHENL